MASQQSRKPVAGGESHALSSRLHHSYSWTHKIACPKVLHCAQASSFASVCTCASDLAPRPQTMNGIPPFCPCLQVWPRRYDVTTLDCVWMSSSSSRNPSFPTFYACSLRHVQARARLCNTCKRHLRCCALHTIKRSLTPSVCACAARLNSMLYNAPAMTYCSAGRLQRHSSPNWQSAVNTALGLCTLHEAALQTCGHTDCPKALRNAPTVMTTLRVNVCLGG